MKKIAMAFTGLAVMLCTGIAHAQDEDTPETYTYATYFYCNVADEGAADKLMERDAEVMDKLVDDKAIKAWGWMSHHTGGQWRRTRWHQSDSIVGALEALDTIGAALEKKFGEDDQASADFARACPRHDDYLWQLEGGKGSGERGKVGFSVYFVCDSGREARADEIMESHAKPFLDKMVEDGSLSSWGWQSHIIGGKVRRLQTMTAKDLPTLLTSRAAVIEAMYPEDSATGQEFVDICGPHVDYIWNNLLGK